MPDKRHLNDLPIPTSFGDCCRTRHGSWWENLSKGLFSALGLTSEKVIYNDQHPYVRDVIRFIDEFLTVFGKNQPTQEKQFNAILSFTVIILAYDCHQLTRLQHFDGLEIAKEIRTVLAILSVRLEVLSQNSVESEILQKAIGASHEKTTYYKGDVIANILLRSRFDQFVNSIDDPSLVAFPARGSDYALLMIKARCQDEIVPLFLLNSLFMRFFISATSVR